MHNKGIFFAGIKSDSVLLCQFMHGKNISDGSFIEPYPFPESRDCSFSLGCKDTSIGL